MFRLLLTGLLFYFSVQSAVANNSIPSSESDVNAIKNLLNIEISAYQLSGAFSAYVLFDGAPKFSRKLESTLTASQQVFENTKATQPNIYKQWQKSINFINENKNRVFDGTDNRLIVGLAIHQNQLYQLIEAAHLVRSNNKFTDNMAKHEYLEASLCFERVIAQYIGFSGSGMGVIHSNISIEDNVSAFNDAVINISNKNAEYQRLLKKWNFIKGNIVSASSQTAPFITLHTANGIRESLQRIFKDELLSDNYR